MATMIAISVVVLPVVVPLEAQLMYNPTESAPRGWYRVRTAQRVRVGDFVVVRLPESIASIADSRGYLPLKVPLLKRVGAVAGQSVCVMGAALRIDGVLVAHVRAMDAAGRRLPSWSGCRVLANGELFLLSTNPSSFDSRYFGPVSFASLRGAAVPMWVW
jgi:conjugative transfer signal peptidase TraF